MNIIFFTQEDPFYVKVFFDEFLKQFKPIKDIKAIVISHPMGKKSIFKLVKQMFEFYGSFDFIRVGLKFLFVKWMGCRKVVASKSGAVPRTYTVKQLAKVYGLNVIEKSDLNGPPFLEMIRKYDPDLFISVAAPVIFREELIRIPKLDCINIHHAPLPRYRGMLPSFWQLYHGEKEAGITIHKIDIGIDTGDIIAQKHVTIEPDENLNDLMRKTKKEGAQLMLKVIGNFRNGNISSKKMEGEGTYFTFPSREDVREFKRMGKRLL